jgi:DNA transposition AAA+ family ATPase
MYGSLVAQIMREYNLSLTQVEKITGVDRTTISQVKNGKYYENSNIPELILQRLQENGYVLKKKQFRVNTEIFIQTQNVLAFKELCDELMQGDLTSSFGIVAGRAGRGKTRTAIWYAVQNPQAVYVLFIDGMTIPQLLREICFEIAGLRPRSFYDCLVEIEKNTKLKRRLILIDEADKMPKKHIEMLRGVNERCLAPIVLIGEEMLTSKVNEERRLKSRVRRVVQFEPLSVSDVVTFYEVAVGLSPDPAVALKLWERAQGDFRVIVRDAYAIARMLNASDVQEITLEMVGRL